MELSLSAALKVDALFRLVQRHHDLHCTKVQSVWRGYLARSGRSMHATLPVEDHADRARAVSPPATAVAVHEWPRPFDTTAARGFCEAAVPDQVLRDGKIRVFSMTWNMHAKPPPEDLSAVFPVGKYHIYAIGTQECERTIARSALLPSKKRWEARLQETFGPDYVMLRSATLQAIHLAVYIQTKLLPVVSSIGSDAVATGLGDTLGNKGGVGVCFTLGSTSMLFVSSHLEAHQERVVQRNQHFHKIDANLSLPSHVSLRPRSDAKSLRLGYENVPCTPLHRATCRFDRVFWLGDLNYRINGTVEEIKGLVGASQAALDSLLERDQLLIEMRRESVFRGFTEGPLCFRPTYKLDVGTDTYDSSKKKRVPSWTDRILVRGEGIELVQYASLAGVRSSDHRPVVASHLVVVDGTCDPSLRGTSRLEAGKGTSAVCGIM